MSTHINNSHKHRIHNLFINTLCAAIYLALATTVAAAYIVAHGNAIQL
jgi:hypothetical protein